MSYNLQYRIKDTVPPESAAVLRLFFSAWLDETCENRWVFDKASMYTVTFDDPEDATVVKLKGVPKDLSRFLELEMS